MDGTDRIDGVGLGYLETSPAGTAGVRATVMRAALWTARIGLTVLALGLAVLLPTFSSGPAAAQEGGSATSTVPSFATSTPDSASGSSDKPEPATVTIERCVEDPDTGEVTCTESTEPAGVVTEKRIVPRLCYTDPFTGELTCDEEIEISGLSSTLEKGESDTFTVTGEDLSGSGSHTYKLRVKRESGVSNIGFSSLCSTVQETVTVPSRSLFVYDYSHDFTLHACKHPGGTVTAELLRDDSVIATEEVEVDVSVQASFSSSTYTVNEGSSVSVTVELNGASSRSLTIPVVVSPGTNRSVSIARGRTSGSFSYDPCPS